MATVPPYPEILKADDWNKKKGAIAKIVSTPTKLGDELRKLEAAYKAVPWDALYSTPERGTPLKAINEQIFKMQQEFPPKLQLLKTELKTCKAFAIEVKAAWGANKLVPPASKTHLDNLIKTFDPWTVKMDNENKAALSALNVIKQQEAYLNEKEAEEEEEVKPVVTAPKPQAGNAPPGAPKLKIKPGAMPPPPPPKKNDEEEGSEGESQQKGKGQVPKPPATPPTTAGKPVPKSPPPPKPKESESRESEGEQKAKRQVPKPPGAPPSPPKPGNKPVPKAPGTKGQEQEEAEVSQ